MYYNRGIKYSNDTRFVPFAAPFLLGALTGGVAVAAVGPRPNNYYPRPNYYVSNYYPYQPYYYPHY